ncbi:hypothetical protein J2S55_005302 [Streptosporangium brasiliense]|uniref:Immunity protein 35 domain-containing protein n=1 Tax=Streptosporangium brasiliense TaxID=47480 RepID=A0ABT9R9V4_9ACTN|nr:hypothetical protein [Streptosporangium brasiliense]
MEMHELPAIRRNRATTPLNAARRLHDELAELGIASDVHDGYGLALVSVWFGLVVWTDGHVFRWGTGEGPERDRRGWHAFGPADDPVTTACRVADRYAELRRTHPHPGPSPWAPQ